MALEDRIKEARKNNGLTQQQAASMIGVAKSTWAGYESGNSTPDIDKIVRIMDALGVDANYLWQDYKNAETKKTPEPEGTEEKLTEEDMKFVADLRAVLAKHGLLGADGDITRRQEDIIFHTICLLRAAFKESVEK